MGALRSGGFHHRNPDVLHNDGFSFADRVVFSILTQINTAALKIEPASVSKIMNSSGPGRLDEHNLEPNN